MTLTFRFVIPSALAAVFGVGGCTLPPGISGISLVRDSPGAAQSPVTGAPRFDEITTSPPPNPAERGVPPAPEVAPANANQGPSMAAGKAGVAHSTDTQATECGDHVLSRSGSGPHGPGHNDSPASDSGTNSAEALAQGQSRLDEPGPTQDRGLGVGQSSTDGQASQTPIVAPISIAPCAPPQTLGQALPQPQSSALPQSTRRADRAGKV